MHTIATKTYSFEQCVQQVLELSTAHIDPQVNAWIAQNLGRTEDAGALVGMKWTYGWMLHTAIDTEPLPGILKGIIVYGQQKGVDWIVLDCDARVCEDLPVHEWRETKEQGHADHARKA